MLKLASAALAGAILLNAGAASAQSPPAAGVQSDRSVSIPFINMRSVRTFEAAPRGEGVYIQNNRRDWYYASFFGRCHDLPFATRIGFKAFGGANTLDQGDTIFAGNERCRIEKIVRSGPPPKKVKKSKRS